MVTATICLLLSYKLFVYFSIFFFTFCLFFETQKLFLLFFLFDFLIFKGQQRNVCNMIFASKTKENKNEILCHGCSLKHFKKKKILTFETLNKRKPKQKNIKNERIKSHLWNKIKSLVFFLCLF